MNNRIFANWEVMIIALISFFLGHLSAKIQSLESDLSSEVEQTEASPEYIIPIDVTEVLATYYNPVPEQCWGDGTITADGSKIDMTKLIEGELRWLAVSHDLLKTYNYGDTVTVDCDIPELSGEWVIHDKMNKRFKKRIDFLIHQSKESPLKTPTKMRIYKTITI